MAGDTGRRIVLAAAAPVEPLAVVNRRGEKRIYVMAHFDHPRELTEPAIAGIDALIRAGVVVVNQCPLIRGINDDPKVLADMFRTLAVIGAPGHVDIDAPGTGTAFVFRFDPSTHQWIEEQELFVSDGAWQDGFGASVSFSRDVIVIGAVLDDDNGANSGSTYVFRFDPDTSQWVEEQKLLASDGEGGDFFGYSVAISGDIALIGANGDDDACPNDPPCGSGAAYVFRFDPKTATWNEEPRGSIATNRLAIPRRFET